MHRSHLAAAACLPLLTLCACLSAAPAGEAGWIDLSHSLDPWKTPHGSWSFADGVGLDPANPKRLAARPGKAVLVNGPAGRTNDLLSKQAFGDLELHAEFLIAKSSNSGIKFHGHYEIQITDSHAARKLTGDSCGGIYPRAELKPRYHHIDDGVAPRVNAARPAGEWQTLDVTFLAPRFDGGKKTANARVLKAVLNGQVIHDNVELQWPTGHAWHNKEMATGPLLLQGDHGPVAFRNVRVRPYQARRD